MLRKLAFCLSLTTFTLACTTAVAPEAGAQDQTRIRARGDDRTCIEAGKSLALPYEIVTIRVDYERKRIRVEPETAVLYVDPEDERRPSQVLWVAECQDKMHYMPEDRKAGRVSDCLQDGDELVVRPKEGCSTELFGKELVIRRGDTAISSGEIDSRMFGKLAAQLKESEKLCDGSSKKEKEKASGMELGTGFDASWLYDVVVRRNGKDLFMVDPQIWIEKDGGSGGG
jgi:hypothetical protein